MRKNVFGCYLLNSRITILLYTEIRIPVIYNYFLISNLVIKLHDLHMLVWYAKC